MKITEKDIRKIIKEELLKNNHKITTDDIVDLLNLIRSGKSFNDEDIKAEITVLLSEKSDKTKEIIIRFLHRMSEIVAPDPIENDNIEENREYK